MDCIKSQNQCVNAVMFPGGMAPTTYTPDTFQGNGFGLKMLYIPFKRKNCNVSYLTSAPSHIPCIFAIHPKNTATYFCIHFHGNACDIAQIAACAQRESNAFNAHYLLVEYPGYGMTDGNPNEIVINEVAEIAYDFVLEQLQVPAHRIVLIGRSIGTGPVCSVASQAQQRGLPPAAVILQSPYSSIRDVAWDLLGSASYCMLNRWENWRYLVGTRDEVIRSPVLFIHADKDQIINCHHSRLLHEHRSKSNHPSELFIQQSNEVYIKGHNYYDYEKDVVQPSRIFLAKIQQNLNIVADLEVSKEIVNSFARIPAEYMDRSVAAAIASGDQQQYLYQQSQLENEKEQNKKSIYRWEHLSCWVCCPCVFCTEGCIACKYLLCRELIISSSCFTPIFDYQRLRPKDGTNTNLTNLFIRKKSFDRLVNEEEAAKTSKQIRKKEPSNEVQNPILAGGNASPSTSITSKTSTSISSSSAKNSGKGVLKNDFGGEEKTSEVGIAPAAVIPSHIQRAPSMPLTEQERKNVNYVPG